MLCACLRERRMALSFPSGDGTVCRNFPDVVGSQNALLTDPCERHNPCGVHAPNRIRADIQYASGFSNRKVGLLETGYLLHGP